MMILGFDFGTKKIGVATGQTVTETASPLQILRANQGKPDWNALDDIVKFWQPNALVVGLPLNEDMTESATSEKAKIFGEKLQHRYQLEVHYVSEYLTSSAARQFAKNKNKNKKQTAQVDAIAAALILESWLKGDAHVG